MGTMIPNLSDLDFVEQAVNCGGLVLVDFWAPWCSPCLTIGRYLEEKAPSFAGRIKIVKVNADEAVEVAARYGVRGLPTLMLLKDGKHIDTSIGALSPSKLGDLLQRWCGG